MLDILFLSRQWSYCCQYCVQFYLAPSTTQPTKKKSSQEDFTSSSNIHIQILQTELYTFPYRISWDNLITDQSNFLYGDHLNNSHSLFSWLCNEKIDVHHTWGSQPHNTSKLNFLEKDKKEHTGEPFSPRISWMTVPGPLESLGRIIYIVIKSIKNEIKIRTLHIL